MSGSVISVARLVNYLKRSVDNDMNLKSVMVSGEISNFTNHRSGHLYFSLKDDQAKMNCVMFKTSTSSLQMPVQNGMKVIVTCSVSMYEAQGSLQLYVTKMVSDGVGDLFLMFEQLKKKLHAEHLFDVEHKKQLPEYPMDIGIISAKTGAAIQDVYSIISRRWPLCKVTLYPSLVQGLNASNDMIEKLKIADRQSHELILLVRGGGSIEDLWCFNDEALARCIYDLNTVIVSGVGHETDTTLVDYVSDARAPTPSAAAELVTPNIEDVRYRIEANKKHMDSTIEQLFHKNEQQFNRIKERPVLQSSEYLLKDLKTRLMMSINRLSLHEVYFQKKQFELSGLQSRLQDSIAATQKDNKNQLVQAMQLMDAYGPLNVLKRGYSIASNDMGIIRSVDDVSDNEIIKIRLANGSLEANVTGRHKDE